jgi:hypothetical protein
LKQDKGLRYGTSGLTDRTIPMILHKEKGKSRR